MRRRSATSISRPRKTDQEVRINRKIELDVWLSKENNGASKGRSGQEVRRVGRRPGSGRIKDPIC